MNQKRKRIKENSLKFKLSIRGPVFGPVSLYLVEKWGVRFEDNSFTELLRLVRDTLQLD